MFPNAAGRTVELATGFGLLIVGSLVATNQGDQTTTFDFIRGLMEAGIGAGTAFAATVDVFVSEEENENDELEAGDESPFALPTEAKTTSRAFAMATALPRALVRNLADMYNDVKLAELTGEMGEADLADFLNRADVQAVIERQNTIKLLPGTLRGMLGSAIGELKELKDSFGGVAQYRAQGYSRLSALIKDMRSAPARYGGSVQLATGQLALPLALYTGIAGAMHHGASSLWAATWFGLSGACMLANYYFKNRSSIAKTKMTLRGTSLGIS